MRIPKFLNGLGISPIIAPFETLNGRLWADLAGYRLILYPFIQGRDGYQTALSDSQWQAFGRAMQAVHSSAIPPELLLLIPRETFSGHWRGIVMKFLQQGKAGNLIDPVAMQTLALLKEKRVEILALISRAERLALKLQARSPEFVLCHADLHAGNLLVTDTGDFFIVDWDTIILAPRERDLMYIGGGQGFPGHTPLEEQELFYRGYGPTGLDQVGLAYYRYERIVEDIAAFCEQLLLSADGGQDREQWFRWLRSNFLPNNTIAIARSADATDWDDI